MNAAELKFNFDLGLKAIEPIRYDMFDTYTISQLMTTSQLALIKRYARIFDTDELIKKLVAPLLKPYIVYPDARTSSNFEYGQFVDLPTDVLMVIEEQAQYQLSVPTHKPQQADTEPAPGVAGPFVPVKPMTYDSVLFNLTNPFKKPYEKLIWRLEWSNKKHELISYSPLVFRYKMRYICNPVDVNLDNNAGLSIAEPFHDEVVDGAIKLAVDIIRTKYSILPQQQAKEPSNDNSN